jgi:RNA polymerase sigma-70 factor (ECF subfamily)
MHTLSIQSVDVAAEPAARDTGTPAATAIVRRHLRGLYRFARALGADAEFAGDLCQEAFVVAWRKGRQDLPDRALAAFLRRSARLLWLQHHRRERRREAAFAAASERLWREEDGAHDDRIAAVRACVDQLRGRAAQAVQLAYGDGRGRAEIAAALGLTPNGVKTLLARTRGWLEQCIGRHRS